MQFTRTYNVFNQEVVPATDDNKNAALNWLEEDFRTSGFGGGSGWVSGNDDGVQKVMRRVFEMQPDVIYLLSDGSFQKDDPTGKSSFGLQVSWDELVDDVEELQKGLAEPARLHFIAFGISGGDWKGARKLARRNDGKAKKFD